MDPSIAHAIVEGLVPCVVMLALGAIPVSLVFISKYFKLKTRELELEAELHGREAQARIRALETRQAAMENGLDAMVQAISRRSELSAHPSLLEAPPAAEPLAAEPPRGLVSLKPKG